MLAGTGVSYTLPTSDIDNKDMSNITLLLEGSRKNHAQKVQLQHDQLMMQNIMRAVNDSSYTFSRLATVRSMQPIINDMLAHTFYGFGYGGDNNSQVVGILDRQLKLHKLVVPSSPRLDPYSYPEDKNERKKLQERDQCYAREDQKYNNQLEKFNKEVAASEKNKAKIKKGIAPQQDMLPVDRQGINFKPIDGKYIQDKNGAYFSQDGSKWKYDTIKNTWKVTTLNGSQITNIPVATAVNQNGKSVTEDFDKKDEFVNQAKRNDKKKKSSSDKKSKKPGDPKKPENKNNSDKLDKVNEKGERKVSPGWSDPGTVEFFKNLKKNRARKAQVNGFGNFYKNPKTGLWWSKDTAGHSGPHYKVFKETVRGFFHQCDVDLLGEVIDKHKGPTGVFISIKDIIFKP